MTSPTEPPEDGAPPEDDAIPMLTEVIELPQYSAPDLPSTLDQVDWAVLARQVQDKVLERLLSRPDLLLEPGLRSALDAVVQRATAQLAIELQGTVAQLVRDAVARAVAEELGRLQARIADPDPGPDAPI